MKKKLAQRGSHFWKPRGARLHHALVCARFAGMTTRVAIYVELLRFELRKIFRGRIAIPALVVSAGMLLGIALINYLVVSPYDRGVYERETALEGRALDDALLAELAAEAEEAGGLSGIGPDSPYYHLAGYISRMQGTYLTIGEGLESEAGNRELTATSVYQMREDLMEYIYDYFGLSDADKQWWKEKEALIEKPFVWRANFGVYSMKSVFGAAINLFCMIAAVCLAGVYAGEKGYRTDSFVLSTREGKCSLWLVKFIAGEIFALAAGTLLLIAGMVPHLLFNGLHGINAPWQLIVPLCAYPYTAGQMLARYILTYYLGCFVIGALVMLFSMLFMNSMAAAGMICLGLVLDLFLSLPPHLGLLSQLRYLTPAQVLINSSMADPRLLRIFGLVLTPLQSARLVYLILTVAAAATVRSLYRRL